MQISKPSQKKLKGEGFKLVVEKKKHSGNTFVQSIDKDWFNRHSGDYLNHSKVYKIYENSKNILIFFEA